MFQIKISILSELGSLGYRLFWLTSGYLAPCMDSTTAAKASITLLALILGASSFLAGPITIIFLAKKVFLDEKKIRGLRK